MVLQLSIYANRIRTEIIWHKVPIRLSNIQSSQRAANTYDISFLYASQDILKWFHIHEIWRKAEVVYFVAATITILAFFQDESSEKDDDW